MRLPGPGSLVFLLYLGLFLPWAARRTAQRLRTAGASGSESRSIPRVVVWRSALLMQCVLLALAWLTASTFGYAILGGARFDWPDLLAALAALAACFGLRAGLRATRSEQELRGLAVYRLAPRTRTEAALWTAVVLLASVAEEAAYRGVGFAILWYALGNPWAAALVMSLVFALAHWVQGWKSGLTVFAIALVFHGLVALTGTLVFAMAVHALYDLIAGESIRRAAQRYDREASAPA